MGTGLNTNMLDDLGTDEDVDVLDNEPDFVSAFRDSLPEDQRAEFDRNFIPKADVTRMRQKDTDRLRSLEERIDQLAQGSQRAQQSSGGNGQGTPDDLQALLEKHGIAGEDKAALRDLFLEYGQSVTQRAVNATLGQMAPFINGVTNDVQARNLAQAKQHLTNNLGKGVEKLWGDVEERCRREMAQGRAVDPETVLRSLFPDEYYNLVASAQSRKRRQAQQQSQSRGMEGMVTQRRSTVFPQTTGRDTSQQEPKGLDASELTASVLKEMGL